MIERILSPALVDAIGWTLLHTLWQGALFALLLGLALVALRTYSAQARYLVAVGFLSAFFLAAGLTAYGHYRQPSEAAALTPVTIAAGAERRAAPLPGATATPTAEPAPTTASSVGLLDRARAYFDRHLPLIVTLWLLGVLVLQLRFLGQLVYVQRLKSYAVSSLPDEWTVRLRALEERLGVRRRVEYLRSHRVESPFTTGWLRPAILLPSRLLDTLGVPELTAILAHELAHIRRNDFAVNVLQTVLGTLFFYHPGVWWMSARIHDEREHCCDDLAVAATGGRIDYARTLVRLQEDQLAAPELAMAYGGGGFGGRVRRLLGGYLGTATFGEGVVTTLIFVAVGSLAIVSTGRASGGLHSPMSMAPASPPETVRPAYEDGSDPSREDVRVLREQLRQRVQRAVREEMRNAAPVVDSTNSFALLMNAIYEGELELVTYLIDRVEDLEGEDERHFFPLMAAASEDEVEIARLLLDRGVDVNHLNSQGWTALTEAADEGSLEVARLLLSAGARVDLRGPGAYRNALEMAASEGHTAMLELLIENGGDPAATNALHLAANEGKVSIVRLLLHLGVDVNGRDEHGRTPLMHAASEDQPAVVRLLLAAGADRTLIDDGGRSAMLYASAEGADESIAEMTDGMAAVALQRLSESPEILLGPAGEGILFTVKAMVEMGIDVNITDDSGNTALSRAAAEGHAEVVRYLLGQGAGVGGSGQTCSPLSMAAREDHPEVIRLLIGNAANQEDGCNFREIDTGNDSTVVAIYYGAPPLTVAVQEGHDRSAALLRRSGSDAKQTLRKERYVLPGSFDWPRANALDSEELRLIATSHYVADGWTPLLEAVESDRPGIVHDLLDGGADPDHRTSTGVSARSLAESLGRDDIIRILQ